MKNLNKNDQNTKNIKPSDSETYESSKKDNMIDKQYNMNERIYKKSIDFFPKKMSIDIPEETEFRQRRYTLEKNIKIKDFVPQIKPIKVYVVPSKFRLNKIGFKDLKCNKNNKILLNAKKYFISCPNLEDEESDKNNSTKDINLYSEKLSGSFSNNDLVCGDKKENINLTRNILQNIKNKNIPKIYSKINRDLKNKYDNELNLVYSSESDLYDIDELNNYSINEKNDENKKENKFDITNESEKNNKGRNRFNSWFILDVLQKNYKLED